MGLINKNDLKLEYSWTTRASDNPIDHDNLGSKVFDRRNGNDVLRIINNYSEKRNVRDKDALLRAEPLIREKMPKDIRTEDDIMNWLWKVLGNEEKERV